ncbi:D-2-hydroxyacid dehydrogenase family protein [Paenibacillus albicereus]|uniref:D-2-hydroxyacid dehydrogenase family protein n=1 Tax=Paenibacillus albicereus TaxID=2726185 RepID=A0A6H2GYM3_9BACL|nr:D-2-hydroxyacid dehydrogenase family protein [Paenibacillus albicereus]QJC52492.1 D-2-hydroxyacid dehydrogenase family protein [Paenibacillus albicereus]
MKKKCTILDDYQEAALRCGDWSRLSDRIELSVLAEHHDRADELAELLRDEEIIVIMRERTPFREELLARLPKLKLLVTTGMRNASIDLEAAARLGIAVSGTRGSSEAPIELTWALLLGLARHIRAENDALRSGGPWQSTIGSDLSGRTLGLLGLGKIGSRVAEIGLAFGMDVLAWSPNLTAERAEAAGAELAASKEELLRRSDFVSVHLVLGDRTRGLIGADELGLMQPHAFLINTSRGPIVDEPALIEALRMGRIAGAGLDVFDVEPLPEDHPFRTLPNVLATPHIGYVTERNYRLYFEDAVEDIEAWLDGAPIRLLQPYGA